MLMFRQEAAAVFTEISSPFNSKIIKIEQDQLGFIWVATESSIQRYDGYQFEALNLDNIGSDALTKVTDFVITENDVIYIATANKGLLKFVISIQDQPVQLSQITDQTIYALILDKQSLWIASDKALYQMEKQKLKKFLYPESKILVSNMIKNSDTSILLAVINTLYKFNLTDFTFKKVNFNTQSKDSYIWGLAQLNDDILVSTDDGLYHGNSGLSDWNILNQEKLKQQIRTIAINEKQVWLGSIKNGLETFQSQANQLVENYQSFNTSNSDLQNNEINHLFLDQLGNLWIGFFNGKINLLSKQALALGHNSGIHMSQSCLEASKFIYHINQDQRQNIWLTTQDGFINISAENADCFVIKPSTTNTLNQKTIPLFTFLTDDDYVWAYIYRLGFIKFNHDQHPKVIETLQLTGADVAIYELIKQQGSIWVFATSSGVMVYDTIKQTLSAEKVSDKKIEASIIKDFYEQPNNQFYLATSRGVAVYDLNDRLVSPLNAVNKQLASKALNAIHIDVQHNLWVGTNDTGLYKFNEKHQLLKHYNEDYKFKSHKNISNIIADDNQNLWITTDNGLIKLSINTDHVNVFDSNDGLQEDSFNAGAAYKTKAGKIYLGGLNGFNAFMPDDIENQSSPKIAISEFKRFNQPIQPNKNYDGFQINQAIAYLNKLTLSHNDYIISFSFTDFNYSSPKKSHFAYTLSGFDPDWNYVDSNNRTATYTNLPSGEYTFKVKGSNQAGEWNQENKYIVIKVNPPPWLSWWAFTSYVLMTMGIIYGYVQHKLKTNQKIAEMLRVEVKEKTKELNVQKQTVESLLVKKNELFSNVSHEFRTPLTLILGPIKELLAKQVETSDIKSLKMINRNANRLLSLVEQLLQIARVSDFAQIFTKPQKTSNQVSALIESFQHMAQSKKIHLLLIENQQAVIDVTEQFIDAVLGNLVSNAIKYTQIGGQVTVNANKDNEQLILTVKDTGSGLSETQKRDIFQRFKRLDSHQNIEGIGIGLSVVEELVKVNDGVIEVISEVGVGSEFIVKVPLSAAKEADEQHTISTLIKQLQQESTEFVAEGITVTDQQIVDESLNTVLVIEDNQDMRAHIVSIISAHYNCLTAENGVKGVASAIEHVPDIIISDVMMPEMDGFKVARVIRSDERTSHIPLMLLTALNDKTNRIKGWRENVDAYMTKPFDRDELLVQLNNMLTIRDILKKKAGQLIKQGQTISAALPKKDQQFIDKLFESIKLNYQDPILNRAKIASEMAVSDRQLQRKVKALIDQNPMDMLREYRLNKAKEKLKDGYQVSQVADDCGFNSLSYFSQCFKAHFGISPKNYQQSSTDN